MFVSLQLLLYFICFFLNKNNIASNDDLSWEAKYFEYDVLSQYSTGKEQIIALIDSGVSEFQSQIVSKNQSFVEEEFDTNGHGTMLSYVDALKYSIE